MQCVRRIELDNGILSGRTGIVIQYGSGTYAKFFAFCFWMVDMEQKAFFAHVSEDGARRETVLAHVTEVAEMAMKFAGEFNGGSWAYIAGLAHDIGKYSRAFQRRLLEGGPKCDHATAGAVELARSPFGWMLSYCVAGHHGGLPDGGSLVDDGTSLSGRFAKAQRGEMPDYSRHADELTLEVPSEMPIPGIESMAQDDMAFALAFRIRMLFSCLVDADFLCTERFMLGRGRVSIKNETLNTLLEKLEDRVASFYPPTTELNETRCRILECCGESAGSEPGVYSLTVPTGGGKTLAAMRFALSHACAHGMRRIVYAAPYTSIIEQNADVYRALFGDSNVLEHHADFDFDSLGDKGESMRLASENWDAPLIVTTNVQLFESLYSSKTSRCRKLHNIAGSVIILDEAQMIPTDYLRPCVRALTELVKRYHCTVLLCTATQPALNGFFVDAGLVVRELAPHVDRLFNELCRVSYVGLGELDDEELVERIGAHRQVLCIVNNRRQARVLFSLMRDAVGSEGIFHLSTLMHPMHRRQTLRAIRQRLNDGKPCRVISTSLVEAGVDLDFPVVYRAVAGLDSMVQAAGRCNREGRLDCTTAQVFLFNPSERYALPRETSHRIGVVGTAESEVLEAGPLGDIGVPKRIGRYFETLYAVKEYGSGRNGVSGLDKQGVVKAFSKPAVCTLISGAPKAFSYPFRRVADSFRLISDGSYLVAIPDEEIEDELLLLEEGTVSCEAMRRIARFSVSVYERDLRSLFDSGLVDQVTDDLFVLLDSEAYSKETGLDVGVKGGKGIYL